jgi:hypothetical protein
MNLFFQKGESGGASNELVALQESVNQIRKRFNELLLSLEDRDDRLIKVENILYDVLKGAEEAQQQGQQPQPQQPQ